MKNVIFATLLFISANNLAQTRTCLYEYFCGENCPPCASTAPGLYTLLASPTNTPKIISIEWETPIPSTPTNTWSIYRTNQSDCDWRYKSSQYGGYGYIPAINYVPHGKIDGQPQTNFSATGDHPAYLNNTVIANAQTNFTPFSIQMSRAWTNNFGAITLTININSSVSFNAVGNLKFRLVMIERKVHFTTSPGTNGQKDFENIAIASFPTLAGGTALLSQWQAGQNTTFTVNCPLPAHVRNKSEVAFVGFIQDDGDRKVWQTALCEKERIQEDAKILSVNIPTVTCGVIIPTVSIKNTGLANIYAVNLTPYIDGVAQQQIFVSHFISADSTVKVTVPISHSSLGTHSFNINISKINATPNVSVPQLISNSYFINLVGAQTWPLQEGFEGNFPPTNWSTPPVNNRWKKDANAGAYNKSLASAQMDYLPNMGEVTELFLPPMDLSGDPMGIKLQFDYAYALESSVASSFIDSLSIYASVDCGINWTPIYLNDASNLITYIINGSNNSPSNYFDWQKFGLTLVGLDQKDVLFKIRTRSGGKGILHLDNFNIRQSNPLSLKDMAVKNDPAKIFPNPANSILNVVIPENESGPLALQLLNTLGQEVWQQSVMVDGNGNTVSIDVSGLPESLYQLVLRYGTHTDVQKLIIQK